MERVLEKSAAAERKFGLLSCEHAFCLGCIRGWRSHHEGGADTDTVSVLALLGHVLQLLRLARGSFLPELFVQAAVHTMRAEWAP